MLPVVSIDQALRIRRQGKAKKKAHNEITTWWVTTEGRQVQGQIGQSEESRDMVAGGEQEGLSLAVDGPPVPATPKAAARSLQHRGSGLAQVGTGLL